MQVTITSIQMRADGRWQVEFDAAHGHGAGIWHASHHGDPQPGNVYQIEFTLEDPVWMQDNAEPTSRREFALAVTDRGVVMTVRVEHLDSDSVAAFRLGADCVFLSDVADPQIEIGKWLRVSIHVDRLGLFPYDAGSFEVIET